MSSLEPISPELRSLLDCERGITPQSEEVRQRALLRARAVIRAAALEPRPKPLAGVRWLLAAAIVFVAANLLAAAVRARREAARSAFGASSALASQSNSLSKNRALPAASASAAPSAPADAPESAELAPPASAKARVAPAISTRALSVSEAYARELRVLEPARVAVARGQFLSALTALAEHERRFPAGQLAEERQALRVQALSGLNRASDARRAAAAFRQRFPGSVLLSRMKDPAQDAP